MHNFMVAAETTGRAHLKDASRRMNQWWLDHIPPELVPHYDFQDPEKEIRPRDPCAAAMAASALMRIDADPGHAPDHVAKVIDATITELCNNYVSAGGVVIHGSLGKVPPVFYGGKTSRLPPGHGAPRVIRARFPQEEIMPYGNYFMAEILHRKLKGDAHFPNFVTALHFR
jgi:unsaturated chondroitin disaccharide hydrolase